MIGEIIFAPSRQSQFQQLNEELLKNLKELRVAVDPRKAHLLLFFKCKKKKAESYLCTILIAKKHHSTLFLLHSPYILYMRTSKESTTGQQHVIMEVFGPAAFVTEEDVEARPFRDNIRRARRRLQLYALLPNHWLVFTNKYI